MKFLFSCAVMNTGKRNERPIGHKSKPHELPLVGFLVYIILDGKTRPSGALPLFTAIEPFAYVVGNYTSQNREDKRNENIQSNPPLPLDVS